MFNAKQGENTYDRRIPLPFIDYLNMVDDLLERYYGITSNDCSLEQVAHRTPETHLNNVWSGWRKEYGLVKIPQ